LRRAGAVAATLLLGVTAAFFVQQQIENAGREIHATPIAQHDTDLLADGSRLEIGAASRVTSRYSEQRREIEVQEGEAFFEVAHDPERPFVVRAGEVRIRAVGTAFNVRRGATRTVVTVSEGAVEVLFKHWYDLFTPAGERRTLARAGEQAVYDRSTGRLHTEAVDTEAATAWRRDSRSFSFLNEPLADVVAYVNRYSERKIVIADDVLARRTFTGSVHHDRGKDWLRALERAYPLRVQQAEDGAIRLVPTDRTLAGQG
jgi:transmembrane sensor